MHAGRAWQDTAQALGGTLGMCLLPVGVSVVVAIGSPQAALRSFDFDRGMGAGAAYGAHSFGLRCASPKVYCGNVFAKGAPSPP